MGIRFSSIIIYLAQALRAQGVNNIFLIGKDSSINLTPIDPPPGTPIPQAVITTSNHSEGYSLSRLRVMITGVYFSNQASRSQLEYRLNRIGQLHDIRILVIHAGIISYIHKHYEKARSLAQCIKGFASEAN